MSRSSPKSSFNSRSRFRLITPTPSPYHTVILDTEAPKTVLPNLNFLDSYFDQALENRVPIGAPEVIGSTKVNMYSSVPSWRPKWRTSAPDPVSKLQHTQTSLLPPHQVSHPSQSIPTDYSSPLYGIHPGTPVATATSSSRLNPGLPAIPPHAVTDPHAQSTGPASHSKRTIHHSKSLSEADAVTRTSWVKHDKRPSLDITKLRAIPSKEWYRQITDPNRQKRPELGFSAAHEEKMRKIFKRKNAKTLNDQVKELKERKNREKEAVEKAQTDLERQKEALGVYTRETAAIKQIRLSQVSTPSSSPVIVSPTPTPILVLSPPSSPFGPADSWKPEQDLAHLHPFYYKSNSVAERIDNCPSMNVLKTTASKFELNSTPLFFSDDEDDEGGGDLTVFARPKASD